MTATALPATAKPAQPVTGAPAQPVDEVDPFIGTENYGEIVPGAYVPFGFAKPSPDCVRLPDSQSDGTSGYQSKGNIKGFSQTHVSGTGGGSKYGNFRITPLAGSLDGVRPAEVIAAGFGRKDEDAKPGYYTATLTGSNVKAELTATRLCAVHRYTFPENRSGILLVDASSVIELSGGQTPLTCEVTIVDGRLELVGRFTGGWNPGEYTLYAVVEFSRPFVGFGTWVENTVTRRKTSEKRTGSRVGGYVTFDTATNRSVEVRVGLSWRSVARARQNLTNQVAKKDFAGVRADAKRLWADNLARIGVDGGDADQRKIFYTALMHAQAMPHDLTGENIWWNSNSAHYEDFYTLWDTFRTVNPLLTLIQPQRQAGLVQSLVETFTHTGWMPDGRIAGHNGYTQGGTNGDVLVADAILKDLPGIDYAEAYKALRKNADVESNDALNQGRNNLKAYKELGYYPYVPPAGIKQWWNGRSASRTLEYAYNDFCIAAVANKRGDTEAAKKDLQRSKYWENLWDATTKSIRPKDAQKKFLEPFDKDQKYRSFKDPFYEGTARQYSVYVPHDVQGVINRTGGDKGFVAWLDELFDLGKYDATNEPDLMAAYLYIHAGRHDRTTERLHALLANKDKDKNKYKTTRGGLPGNDDAGTLSAWYVWGALGLYPNVGQDWYYIGSPLFPQTRVTVSGGTLTIKADGVSAAAKYVQSATLNGRPLDRAWLRHREIVGGGALTLKMGPTASKWATGPAVRPPSASSPT